VGYNEFAAFKARQEEERESPIRVSYTPHEGAKISLSQLTGEPKPVPKTAYPTSPVVESPGERHRRLRESPHGSPLDAKQRRSPSKSLQQSQPELLANTPPSEWPPYYAHMKTEVRSSMLK